MDRQEEEEKGIFFAKILKITKYTSLPNLVRLGQWEQVSPYYYYSTTLKIGACRTSSPTQQWGILIDFTLILPALRFSVQHMFNLLHATTVGA